jgi:hypothetical protein
VKGRFGFEGRVFEVHLVFTVGFVMIMVMGMFFVWWFFDVIFLDFSVVDVVAEEGLVGLDVDEVVFIGERGEGGVPGRYIVIFATGGKHI